MTLFNSTGDIQKRTAETQRGRRPRPKREGEQISPPAALSHQQSAVSFPLRFGKPHMTSRILCGPQMGSPRKFLK
jgi:hypothetical protein